jgi:hypothetical protein
MREREENGQNYRYLWSDNMNYRLLWLRSSNVVVEHSILNPNVEGSNPATGDWREKMAKTIDSCGL